MKGEEYVSVTTRATKFGGERNLVFWKMGAGFLARGTKAYSRNEVTVEESSVLGKKRRGFILLER